MKYFLHDSNSFNDEKITELFISFGYEGLGLFYTILEKLALQEKPVKTSVLKSQLKVGKKLEKCWNFMESLELISSNNGETFNKQLINFSGKYSIKKEKNAKRISEWREKQEVTKNVTHYEQVCNTPKVKESKVNRNKDNISKDIESSSPPKFSFKKSFLDLGVSEEVINDWLIVRKNKKASNTETAFNAIKSEIDKTKNHTAHEIICICAAKDWKGFKNEWLANNNQNSFAVKSTQPAPESTGKSFAQYQAEKALAQQLEQQENDRRK